MMAGSLLAAMASGLVGLRIVQGGWFPRYPLVFIRALASFLATIAGTFAYMLFQRQVLDRGTYAIIYWAMDALAQGFTLCLLVSLVWPVSRRFTPAKVMLFAAAGAMAAFVVLVGINSFTGSRQFNLLMAEVSRDLSFAGALLNVAVWRRLLASQRPEPQELLVSAGVGMQSASAALANALRTISASWTTLAGTVMIAGFIFGTVAWYFAFRRDAGAPPESGQGRRPSETGVTPIAA